MNKKSPLPLTGGVPQPLTELSQCILSAECTSSRSTSWSQIHHLVLIVTVADDETKGAPIEVPRLSSPRVIHSSSSLVIPKRGSRVVRWHMP